MRFPRRREEPPETLLPPGQKSLAAARTRSGEWVIGTRDVLVLPGRTLPWERVLSAQWDSDTDRLTVVDSQPAAYVVEVDEPGGLVELIRERVTASIVLTRRVDLTRGGGFTVMARRPPSGGEITFTVEYDKGLDPDLPDVQETARAALAQARGELGM